MRVAFLKEEKGQWHLLLSLVVFYEKNLQLSWIGGKAAEYLNYWLRSFKVS